MKRKTSDAVEILESLISNDRKSKQRVNVLTFNARIAQMIYQARAERKLTQKQLARLIGTTQPVIARLEDATYKGHSLPMLKRIADALGARLEINLIAPDRKRTGKAVA